jgi:hypothetical protein
MKSTSIFTLVIILLKSSLIMDEYNQIKMAPGGGWAALLTKKQQN